MAKVTKTFRWKEENSDIIKNNCLVTVGGDIDLTADHDNMPDKNEKKYRCQGCFHNYQ